MSKIFLIKNAAAVWNKPSYLKDGLVVKTESFNPQKYRWGIGLDDEGREMYVDEGDIDNGYIEEYEGDEDVSYESDGVKQILINDALSVWNKESDLKDGDVIDVDFVDEKGKIYLNAHDKSGKQVFVDMSDLVDGYAEYY